MRMVPSGRGLPPEIDADCLHLWPNDDTAVDAADLLGSYPISAFLGSAGVGVLSTSSVGPRLKTFDGTLQARLIGASTAPDNAAMEASVTVVGCISVSSGIAAPGTVLSYGDSATSRTLFSFYVDDATRLITAFHSDAGGVARTFTSTYALPLGRNVPFAIRRAISGGTATYSLFLYGEHVEDMAAGSTATDLPNAGGGTGHRWVMGASVSGSDNFHGTIDCLAVYAAAKTSTWIENQLRRMRRIGFPDVIHSRVKVEDGGGIMRDVDDLGGVSWLDSWDVQDSVDQKTATATVNLLREQGSMSLAKFTDGRLNRVPVTAIGPDSSTYDADAELIDGGRDITIEVARVPMGLSPATRDWQTLFNGEIDTPEWGGDEPVMRLECRDKACLLQDTMIEEIVEYPENDAEVTMQAILDGNGCGAFSLYTPTSPGWVIKTYKQETGVSVMDALDKIAQQIGWCVRYVFDEGSGTFRLTFYQPDRTYSVTKAMAVLTTDDYQSLNRLSISRANIRNAGRVSYDSQESPAPSSWTYEGGGGGLATDGQPTRAWVKADADDLGSNSITRFGRRFFEPGEPAGGNIDRKEEAEAWLVAMLRDLMDPVADASLQMWMLESVALGTCIKIRRPLPHSNGDQRLAVTGFHHHGDSASTTTELSLRGAPCGGVQRHLSNEARPGQSLAPVTNGRNVLTAMTTRGRLAPTAASYASAAPIRSPRIPIPPNHDFSSHIISRQAPPDGWTQTGGTWGTDASVDATNALTGFQSLDLLTASAVLKSGFVPVQAESAGGDTESYQVAVPVKVSGTTTVTVDVEWYDADRVLLSSSTPINVSVTAGSWRTLRGVAIAPATARFAKYVLSRGAGGAHVYVDRVLAQSVKPSFRALVSADYSVSDKTNVVVEFDVDNGGRANGSWDDGNNYDAATNYVFTAPEDAWYEFSASVEVSNSGAGNYVRAELRLYGDATEIARGAPSSNLVGDSAVASIQSGLTWLTSGTEVSVQLYAEEQAASPLVIANEITFFVGRMVSNE